MWRSGYRASRKFSRDQSGVATVEFALVAMPFMAMIVAVVESLTTQYYSSALDHAVQRFASDVRNGVVILGVGSSAMTAQGVKNSLTPLLPSSFVPTKLQVKLMTRTCGAATRCWASEYSVFQQAIRRPPAFDASASLPFNIGAAGASQYLTVYYPAPALSRIWSSTPAATVNGERVFGILSAAMWTNDPSVGVF